MSPSCVMYRVFTRNDVFKPSQGGYHAGPGEHIPRLYEVFSSPFPQHSHKLYQVRGVNVVKA